MSALADAYSELGADYEDVVRRLMNEQLVARFVKKFLEDDTFNTLKTTLVERDVDAAFMAAHTLKGVCQNLGFSNLYEPASQLTEVLRAKSFDGADELFAEVEKQYNLTAAAIHKALDE